MMKKMIACIATGLCLAGMAGIAQAAGSSAREYCCTEGPAYNRGSIQGPVVPTKVVLDQGSPYIEGMGFAPRTKAQKTIVPKVSDRCDFCSEGFSEEELNYMLHLKEVYKLVPAAGN